MSQSNSVELIRNKIAKIILLEKNADVFFNDILEPFVNELYQQKMVPVQTLRENGWSALLERYPQLENDVVLSRLCDFAGALEWREIIIEMMRFATFIKLVRFVSSSELIELTCNSLKNDQVGAISLDNCKNVILTYLHSKSVVDGIEQSFYSIDASGAERTQHLFVRYVSKFLELTFPEANLNEAIDNDVVLKLLKFLNSRMIHVQKPESSETFYFINAAIVGHFFQASGLGKAFSGFALGGNHELFAEYLYQTGDLVALIFDHNTDFFELFQIRGDDVKFYKRYLPTESLKARFDMNAVCSDYSKNKSQKVIACIKYYCWTKWIALFADLFCKNQTTVTAIVDNQLSTDSNANVNLALSVRTNYEQNEPRGQDNSQTEL